MKWLILIAGALILIFGVYLLIDSARLTRPYLSFHEDFQGSVQLIFTQAIQEALLGIGAILVALIFVVSGFSVHFIEATMPSTDLAGIERAERYHKELLAALKAKKTSH